MEVRRAVLDDHRAISALIATAGGSGVYRKRFGAFNSSLIDSSYLAIVVCHPDDTEGILGFAAFSDAPKDANLEEYLKAVNAAAAPSSPRMFRPNNCAFLTFAVVSPEGREALLSKLLTTVYTTVPDLDYLFCGLPPEEACPAEFQSLFKEVLSADAEPLPGKPGPELLLCCERELLVPTLAVRTACVEDHDDLIPIFNQQSELLSDTYGDFFLAELIESQDRDNRALVALAGASAVGFMGVSADVDTSMLQRSFQLEAFDYLVKLPQGWTRDMVAQDEDDSEASAGEQRAVASLSVLGGPLSGSTEVAADIAERYRLVLVEPEKLVATAARQAEEQQGQGGDGRELHGEESEEEGAEDGDAGSTEGREQMQSLPSRVAACLEAGQGVPDSLLTDLVLERLAERDCTKQGYVLVNFPATAAQARVLMAAGVSLTALVTPIFSDFELITRIVNQQRDPETGVIYDSVETAPQDGALQARLVPVTIESEETVTAFIQETLRSTEEVVALLQAGITEETKYDAGPDARGTVVLEIDGEAAGRDVPALLRMCCDALEASPAAQALGPLTEAEVARDAALALERALRRFDCNAFAVSVFCVDQAFESRVVDFLPHAFDQFPEREYLVLTLPTAVPEPALLRQFNLAPPKAGAAFSHSLYLLHRDFLLAAEHLVIDRYQPGLHHDGLSRLAPDVPAMDAALALAERDAEVPLDDNPGSVVFTATIGRQVVGALALDRRSASSDRLGWIRTNFDIDRFAAVDRTRARHQALLSVFVVNPIFAAAAPQMLQHAMRLFEKTIVYHECVGGAPAPGAVLQYLVPVAPRSRPQPLPGVSEAFPPSDYDPEGAAFSGVAVHMMARRLLSEAKVNVNSRVVVVGCTPASIAAIQKLLFTSYLNFTNITLVSPSGLPGGLAAQGAGELPLLGARDEDLPPDTFTACLGLRQRLRWVERRVVGIDREAKALELEGGVVLPYDKLVLGDAMVDSTPSRLADTPVDEELLAQGQLRNRHGQLVSGVVSICREGSVLSTRLAHNLARTLGPASPVIIYGSSYHAAAAVQWLLACGVPAENITFVRPGWGQGYVLQGPFAGLKDPKAESLLDQALAQANVASRSDLTLEDVNADSAGGICSATFAQDPSTPSAEAEAVTLDCHLLLTCHAPDVRPGLFHALNESGLVYDGRLVVDSKMRTSDAEIYAGGDLTKFSRKYRHPVYHDQYNPREIGCYMGSCLLEAVDPLSAGTGGRDAPRDTLPTLLQPRAMSMHLPTGLNYSRIACARKASEGGGDKDLGTGEGDCSSILTLDRFGRSVELTYIGRDPIETRNLACVVGLQEGYLNSCHAAFTRGHVSDWADFFRQDWAHALYHDRFEDFVKTLREQLRGDLGASEIVEALSKAVGDGMDDMAICALRASAVGTSGEKLQPSTRKIIETSTLEFLKNNKSTLPEYLIPDIKHHHK